MTTRLNYYKSFSQVYFHPEATPIPTLNTGSSNIPENFTVISTSDDNNLGDVDSYNKPSVFGPAMWNMYHKASLNYPENASPLFAERMKYCIIGLPMLIPCISCQEHATAYIEQHRHLLNSICSGRENLFKFFVDFHNYVNKRLGKQIYSYEEALIIHTNEINFF